MQSYTFSIGIPILLLENSNILMFFIGNCKIIVLLDSKNRAISSLTACIFQTNGLFPSDSNHGMELWKHTIMGT